MISIKKIVIKYPVITFFILSYILSWALLLFLRGLLPQGVALAAIIVIALTTGRKGLREFWSRLINFRAGYLFLVALAIIVCFKLADITSSILTGGTFGGFPNTSFVTVAIWLLFFGGQWEEPGWTGYALPTLQKRFANAKYGPLIATLIVGAGRGIWHLPLVLVGAIPWYDAVLFSPFVFQPFISWLYNKSGGSVPLVIFFHYMSNLLFAISPVFTGADKQMYAILYMAVGILAALALVWKTGFKLGWHEDSLSGVKTNKNK